MPQVGIVGFYVCGELKSQKHDYREAVECCIEGHDFGA